MSFDLNSFDKLASDEGAWMHVMDPVKDTPLYNVSGQPVRMKLVGTDSPLYRKKQREIMNRRLMKKKIINATAEQFEENQVELVMACTVGWEGFILNGQELQFNDSNMREVYINRPALRFIVEQADRFIGDRSNFLPS